MEGCCGAKRFGVACAPMPDLDLEPKDYRGQPLKGEKVFAPGGLKRLGLYAAFVALMIVIAVAISVPYNAVFNMLWPG